jgi:glycine cleavage system H protein
MTETRFTKDHEWVCLDGSLATIGITDFAQAALGDIVFIELPELEREVASGEGCAVVESVKAASDICAPLAGRVSEINPAVTDDPTLVNRDATGKGWFFRMMTGDTATFGELLDEAAYKAYLEKL